MRNPLNTGTNVLIIVNHFVSNIAPDAPTRTKTLSEIVVLRLNEIRSRTTGKIVV